MKPDTLAEGIRVLLETRPLLLHPGGRSMAPAIFPGDRVTLVAPGLVRVGDVVLVGSTRLHRVIRIDQRNGTVVTQGDAVAQADPPVQLTEVVARVAHVQRSWSGRLRHWVARFRTTFTRHAGSLPWSRLALGDRARRGVERRP